MSLKSNSQRLSELESLKREVARKIIITKKRVRDQSRVRAAIRSRILGECLIRLQHRGRINGDLMEEILEDLLDHTAGKNIEFESLQGSAFDLTALLHEISVECPQEIECTDPGEVT